MGESPTSFHHIRKMKLIDSVTLHEYFINKLTNRRNVSVDDANKFYNEISKYDTLITIDFILDNPDHEMACFLEVICKEEYKDWFINEWDYRQKINDERERITKRFAKLYMYIIYPLALCILIYMLAT